jgi:hypothetical protein
MKTKKQTKITIKVVMTSKTTRKEVANTTRVFEGKNADKESIKYLQVVQEAKMKEAFNKADLKYSKQRLTTIQKVFRYDDCPYTPITAAQKRLEKLIEANDIETKVIIKNNY